MFDQQVTFLYTRDLDASALFYEQTLELPLILDQGACRIFQSSPHSVIGVCTCSEERPSNPDGIIVTLVSNDVDGWYDTLRSKGVMFDTPPSENPAYNIYHCFLKDPDGYQIEIQSFRDVNWPDTASAPVNKT